MDIRRFFGAAPGATKTKPAQKTASSAKEKSGVKKSSQTKRKAAVIYDSDSDEEVPPVKQQKTAAAKSAKPNKTEVKSPPSRKQSDPKPVLKPTSAADFFGAASPTHRVSRTTAVAKKRSGYDAGKANDVDSEVDKMTT
ncbi:uncharacterized protein LOC144867638 [Branchiostoma floridae x Branchiostoma japonicum]